MEIIYNSSYYRAVRNHIEIPRALKYFDNVSQSIPDRHYFEVINLVKQKKQEGKWLDVGGGIGVFLNHLQKKSSRYSLFLNESNRDSTHFAHNFYNLNVLPLTPEQLLKNGQKFDIISMLAVLEHINKPYDFLLAYLDLLADDGLFVLTLPNYTFLNRLFSRQHSPNVIPPYHPSLFNADNIRILFERLNFLYKMEIHFSGESAFKFWHLAKWSEYSDVKIPMPGDLHQECFLRRQPSFCKKIILKGFEFLDRRLSLILAKLDGGVFMHIIVLKHCCRN